MANRTASSASNTDVNFAINGGGPDSKNITFTGKLVHGETCFIPQDTPAPWTTTITVTQNINIIGAGIGKTVITGGLLFIVKPTSRIAAVGTPDSHRIKISGMTWTRNKQAYTFRMAGACPIDENNIDNPALSGGFEIDHILINATDPVNSNSFVFDMYGWPEGVVHHMIYDLDPTVGGQHFVTNHCWAPDGTGGYGDYSWSNPGSVGTIHQIYIEDCIVKRSGSFECNINSGTIAGGARYCCRHITTWGTAGGGHESRSDAGNRVTGGLRCAEAYKNLYLRDAGADPSDRTAVRSGEAVHWGNRHNRYGAQVPPLLNQHQLYCYVNGAWNSGPYPAGTDTNKVPPAPYPASGGQGGTGLGGADGANPWDLNANGNLININFNGNNFVPIGAAQNVADTVSGGPTPVPNLSSIYASGDGTAGKRLYRDDTPPAAGTNINLFHIDATLPLPAGVPDAPDRWRGFVIRNLDAPTRDCLAPVSFGIITVYNPTAKTFTVQDSNEPNDAKPPGHNAMRFKIVAGQRWEIRRVVYCFGTCGCGSMTTGHPDGSLIGGFMQPNAMRLTDGTRTYTNFETPGCSMWDNKYRVISGGAFNSIPTWAGLTKYADAAINARNTASHPGYSYLNDGSTPTQPGAPAPAGPNGGELRPDTRIGADADIWAIAIANAPSTNIAGTQNGAAGGPFLYEPGIGGYIYPHPFVVTAGARFTSSTQAQFSTNGGTGQQFTVTTAGFTGTVTITRTGTVVTGLTFASTPGTNPTATFTGQPTVAAGTYTQHLKAHSTADGDVLMDLDIQVLNPDLPPTIDTFTISPAAPYTAPVTLTLTATVGDDHGIASVGFYEGTNLINQLITTSPYQTVWTGVAAGTYSLTVKATDTASPANVTQSSPAKSITVASAPTTLEAPTIVVTG